MRITIEAQSEGDLDMQSLYRVLWRKIGSVLLSEEDGVEDRWAVEIKSIEVEE